MSQQPLKGDPQRQAIPALEGYIYQIWSTVYSWVNLKKGEALYLEGAEDIDKLQGGKVDSSGSAEAIQVKSESGNVTLRSKSVLKSIVHYWVHNRENKTEIRFRLLTTSERGYEKGKPFTDAENQPIKGLDLWDRLRDGGDLSELLEVVKKALSSFDHPASEDIISFINESDHPNIRESLIKPIEWNTASESRSEIQRKVEELIVSHGKSYGVLPSKSKSSITDLLHHVSEIILNENIEDRRLDQVDFEEVFEQSVTERVHASEHKLLNQIRDGEAKAFLSAEQQSTAVSSEYRTLKNTPSPQDGLLCREELIMQIEDLIELCGFAHLTGITGRGKSVAAKFVAQRSNYEWQTLRLRGIGDLASIRQHLRKALAESRHSTFTNLLIDDLSTAQSGYTPELAELINAAWDHNRSVIITSQSELPVALLTELELSDNASVVIPHMTEEEVRDLIRLHAPNLSQIRQWAKDIFLVSRGNPQLAHARTLYMSQQDWPESELLRFERSESEERVLRDVKKDLKSTIPSKDAREVLYRTSVFFGSFTRERALYVCGCNEAVKHPGDHLDILVGPYIEREGGNSLRLSPLFHNSAEEYFTAPKRKDLHSAAGESLMAEEISPPDLSNLFSHALLGESPKVMAAALHTAYRIPDEDLETISNHLDIICHVNINNNRFAFESDLSISFKLRYIQLRIACSLKNKGLASQVAEAWWRDLRKLERRGISIWSQSPTLELRLEQGLDDEDVSALKEYATAETQKLLLLIRVAQSNYAQLETSIMVDLICDNIKNVTKNGLSLFPGLTAEAIKRHLDESRYDGDEAAIILDFLNLYDCPPKDRAAIIEGLANKEACSPLLGMLESRPSSATQLIDQIWMHGVEEGVSDWKEYIGILTSLKQRLDQRFLKAAVLRAIAVIEAEHLDDPDAALSTLDRAPDEVSRHPIVKSYKSTISYRLDDYGSVISAASEVNASMFSRLDAAMLHRRVGIAYVNLEKWHEARQSFSKAEKASSSGGFEVLRVGFVLERSLVHWRSENKIVAVEELEAAIADLSDLPDPHSNLNAFALHKLVDATFLYMLKDFPSYEYLLDHDRMTVPYHGIYTELDRDSQLRELPLADHATRRVFLNVLKYELGKLSSVPKELWNQKEGMPLLGRIQLSKLRVRSLIKAGEYDSILEPVLDLSLSQVALKDQTKSSWRGTSPATADLADRFLKDNTDLVFTVLSIASIGAGAEGALKKAVEEWKRSVKNKSLPNITYLRKFLKFYDKHKNNKEIKQLINGELVGWKQTLKCASLMGRLKDPSELFILNIHIFNTISENEFQSILGEEIVNIACASMSNSWLEVLEERKFMLQDPLRHASKIRAGCQSKDSELGKMAAILNAARHAVPIRLPDEMVRRIEEYAGDAS